MNSLNSLNFWKTLLMIWYGHQALVKWCCCLAWQNKIFTCLNWNNTPSLNKAQVPMYCLTSKWSWLVREERVIPFICYRWIFDNVLLNNWTVLLTCGYCDILTGHFFFQDKNLIINENPLSTAQKIFRRFDPEGKYFSQ